LDLPQLKVRVNINCNYNFGDDGDFFFSLKRKGGANIIFKKLLNN
jgi:hypothetical protein